MKRCDCEHWEICPTCFPQGFDEDGNIKPAERPPTRAELVEKIAALEAERDRLTKLQENAIILNAEKSRTIAQQAEGIEELSFDAAMADQAREIGNHFGLTYMQVWSDTSIASQVIDKMKEQQATIAQQAEQLAAAEKDAERLNFLDTLSQRVDPSIIKCNWLNSDMHFANGCVTLYLRNCVGRATFTGLEKSVREVIDAAIAASREGKS